MSALYLVDVVSKDAPFCVNGFRVPHFVAEFLTPIILNAKLKKNIGNKKHFFVRSKN